MPIVLVHVSSATCLSQSWVCLKQDCARHGLCSAVFSLALSGLLACCGAVAVTVITSQELFIWSRYVNPRNCGRVAQRAMAALGEAFETVLQFLELVQAEGSPSIQTGPWLLAAIRAYGRQAPPSCRTCDHCT